MTDLLLDGQRSSICLRTRAEGLFSRLAHALALRCDKVTGTATSASPGTGEGTIVIAVHGITIEGTLDRERIVPDGLSASDRQTCLEKMRREVFDEGTGRDIVVTASLERGVARAQVSVPGRRQVTLAVRPVTTTDKDEIRLVGSVELSLAALGVGVVRGPMNAFRVSDAVEVRFDVVFVPAGR